jgi:hypothetical protein
MFTLLLTILAVCHGLDNPIIIDTDGGFDDLVAVMLPIIQDSEKVKAITIVPGNSYIQPALWSINKILELFKPTDKPAIPVGYSNNEGVHPFPSKTRDESFTLAKLPFWADEIGLLECFFASCFPSSSRLIYFEKHSKCIKCFDKSP